MMICSRPLGLVSMRNFPRSTTLPRPVCMPAFTPSIPKMIPPVGKSGAFTCNINSSMVISRFSINAIHPSITSRRLCGIILVAIPTAIPLDPLISKVGIRVGKTVGSFRESSKLNWKSTVSLSISSNIFSAMR